MELGKRAKLLIRLEFIKRGSMTLHNKTTYGIYYIANRNLRLENLILRNLVK